MSQQELLKKEKEMERAEGLISAQLWLLKNKGEVREAVRSLSSPFGFYSTPFYEPADLDHPYYWAGFCYYGMV